MGIGGSSGRARERIAQVPELYGGKSGDIGRAISPPVALFAFCVDRARDVKAPSTKRFAL
jgi:hypothetical protein